MLIRDKMMEIEILMKMMKIKIQIMIVSITIQNFNYVMDLFYDNN